MALFFFFFFLYLLTVRTQECKTILENDFILETDTGLFFPFNVEEGNIHKDLRANKPCV